MCPPEWLLYVHMYILPGSTWRRLAILDPKKGTRTVPFSSHPCGDFYFYDWVKVCELYILYKVPGDTPLAPFFARKGDPNGPLF